MTQPLTPKQLRDEVKACLPFRLPDPMTITTICETAAAIVLGHVRTATDCRAAIHAQIDALGGLPRGNPPSHCTSCGQPLEYEPYGMVCKPCDALYPSKAEGLPMGDTTSRGL